VIDQAQPQLSRDAAPGEWASGWRPLVAACAGVGTTWIFFQLTAGLFIIPMQTEFGWSRSAVAVGPLAGLVSMLFYPLAGALIDRYGARPVALCGVTSLAVGFLMLAAVPANRTLFYCVVVFVAIAGAAANPIVFSKGIATWFVNRFGSALGLMMSGVSVTSALGIPLLSAVIAHFGWRVGYLALAGLIALLGLPLTHLWFRARPTAFTAGTQHSRSDAGVTLREAIRQGQFWLLTAAVAGAAVPIGGFLTHLQPLLAGSGVPRAAAAGFGSVFVLAIGSGRLGGGMLLDRMHPPYVACGLLTLSGLGALVMARIDPGQATWPLLVLAVSMIGLAEGAESDYLAFFSLRLFGTRSFSKIVGILLMGAGAGMALGGLLFAALFDRYHSYAIALRVSVAAYLLAALLFALLKVPPLRRGACEATLAAATPD
jgi:predicted MFS family arabinose efflux permease